MKYIGIHGVPRSGTSWLAALVDSSPSVLYKLQPLFSYALKGFLNHESSREQIEEFFQKLQFTKDDFLDQVVQKRDGKYPIFKKNYENDAIVYKEARYHHILENMLFQFPEVKVVGIVRNPLSVLSSWRFAPKEFRVDLGWDFDKEWFYAEKKNQGKPEEYYGYAKWKEVAIDFVSFKEKFPENFFLVRYKDLVENTLNQTEEIFNFLSIKIEKQTYDFISQSINTANTDPYTVFRKEQRDDKWKDTLDQAIIDYIIKDCENERLDFFIE